MNDLKNKNTKSNILIQMFNDIKKASKELNKKIDILDKQISNPQIENKEQTKEIEKLRKNRKIVKCFNFMFNGNEERYNKLKEEINILNKEICEYKNKCIKLEKRNNKLEQIIEEMKKDKYDLIINEMIEQNKKKEKDMTEEILKKIDENNMKNLEKYNQQKIIENQYNNILKEMLEIKQKLSNGSNKKEPNINNNNSIKHINDYNKYNNNINYSNNDNNGSNNLFNRYGKDEKHNIKEKNIGNEKYKNMINKFKEEYNLNENYSDEKILNALKINEGDFSKALIALEFEY